MLHDETYRPLDSVLADQFMVYVDKLSGWPVIAHYGNETMSFAIQFFKIFREYGVPVWLQTDGGPQFANRDFQDFLRIWGVHHISKPYKHRSCWSSCQVSETADTIGGTWWKHDIFEFDHRLLEIRNMLCMDGHSPAQILHGHSWRSCAQAEAKSFVQIGKQK